jgi:predicted MFS family arabinose efflux permease
LSNSQFYPANDPQVTVYLAISLIGFILFFRRERKSKSPLLRLEMFRNLKFTSTVIVGAITSAGMFSTIYMLPLFARTVQLSDATEAGLLLLPGGLALAFVSPVAGRLVDRMPAHRLLYTGIVLFVISIYALTLADDASSFWMVAGWVVLGRAALGLILPANSTLSLSSVSAPQVPQASGALNFCRMLGGTIGVNVIAVLITARSAHYGAEMMAANGGAALTSDQSVQMMTLTFHDCFLVSCLVFALALIPVTYLARHSKT